MDDPRSVILCGSGPSLKPDLIFGPGLPVAAVSTSIRVIHRPMYWILVDRMNAGHAAAGVAAAKNPDIIKVIPDKRMVCFRAYPNVIGCGRRAKEFLDDSDQVTRVFNRSMLFAIEWLMKFGGYQTLIFAGLDLRSDRNQPYVHDRKLKSSRINSANQNHRNEFKQLAKWSMVARDRGYTWLSWTPDSPINEIMEPFDAADRGSRPGDGAAVGGGADLEPAGNQPGG